MIKVESVTTPSAPITVQLVAQDATGTDQDFTGGIGETRVLLAHSPCQILAGIGDTTTPAHELARAGSAAVMRAQKFPAIAFDFGTLEAATAIAVLRGAVLRATAQWSQKSIADEDAPRLAKIEFFNASEDFHALWEIEEKILRAVLLARTLITLPGNLLNPQNFASHLAPLREAGVQFEQIEAPQLKQMGCGGILAVGQASATPPVLLTLRWPGNHGAPVALVGKGITFDTGGISIKPADLMWEMRADMAGAAAAAATIYALALQNSPTPAIAVLALAENAIGDTAYRPSDIIKMHSGLTVEVIDTDAEGRMVLADALAYAVQSLAPRLVIDLATLTGSIVSALGHARCGVFSNHDDFAGKLHASGEATGELTWRMPIDETHREEIKSDIADLRHCSPERMRPDACIAAAFLSEFAGKQTAWLHIDIAGVESWEEADDDHPAGARGFGVRLLDHFLKTAFS